MCMTSDLSKNIMYASSLFMQRKNETENCDEQDSLFGLGSVLYSL